MTKTPALPQKPAICTKCGYFMDAVSHPTDASKRPKPGDFSLCMSCGDPMRFNDDLSLRAATQADFAEMNSRELAQFELLRQVIKTAFPDGLARRKNEV